MTMINTLLLQVSLYKKIIMFIIKQAVEIHVVEKIFNLTEQISAIKCFN